METISNWPSAILRRWIGLFTIGIICLLIGAAAGVALKDRIMFLLSASVCAACLIRAGLFYRLVTQKEYEVIEGVCVEIKQWPLQKNCRVKLVDRNEDTHVLSLEKRSRIHMGRCYRVYLHRRKEGAGKLEPSAICPDSLLGLEEIEDSSLVT